MLRAAILGCGNIAGGYDERLPGDQVMTHAKAYSGDARVQLVGASDTDPKRLAAFADYWKVPVRDASAAALLKEVSPDIVSICTPNASHFKMVELALVCKPRAILCEKPIALTALEAQKIQDLCEAQGTLLVVNYLRRWDQSTVALGRRILAGEFGQIQSARVLFTKGVFHNASHGINLLQDWLGDVKRATRLGRITRLLDGDVQTSFLLEFERCDQVVFQYHDSQNYNFFEIDLCGSKGRIQIPWNGQGILLSFAEVSPIVPGEQRLGNVREVMPWTQGSAMRRVVSNLVDSILVEAPLAMPAHDAVRTIEICEMIRNEVSK